MFGKPSGTFWDYSGRFLGERERERERERGGGGGGVGGARVVLLDLSLKCRNMSMPLPQRVCAVTIKLSMDIFLQLFESFS